MEYMGTCACCLHSEGVSETMKPQMQIAQGWYLVACYSVEGRVSYTDRTVPYPYLYLFEAVVLS